MQDIKNQQGITLVETVIALGILVTGLLAVITLSTASINLSRSSGQQIVVANLAREGMEIVRQVRDYSKSGNTGDVLPSGETDFFSSGVDGCYVVDADTAGNFGLQTVLQGVGSGCTGDNFLIEDCTNCSLYRDATTGLYSHDPNDNTTIFKRAVKVESLNDHEKRILSKVVWNDPAGKHNMLLETHLTDW